MALEPELEPEPTTEVLFLCSHDSCGKIFIDAGALRKHADIHAERQHVCWFEGCGKVFFPDRVSYGIEIASYYKVKRNGEELSVS